jgi:hypothetical protein
VEFRRAIREGDQRRRRASSVEHEEAHSTMREAEIVRRTGVRIDGSGDIASASASWILVLRYLMNASARESVL